MTYLGTRPMIAHQKSGIIFYFTGIAWPNHFGYNTMAPISLWVDSTSGWLDVHLRGSSVALLKVPLPLTYPESCTLKSSQSCICGDRIIALVYTSPHITDSPTTAVDIPCAHSRFPVVLEKQHFKPRPKTQSSIQGHRTE